MTRIIAGTAGGRSLRTPKGDRTRPTSDRVREALFSALAARGVLAGARVLDLYAGSGAVGLEALSRGAAVATLVEADRATAGLIRANATSLGLRGVEVVGGSVEAFLAGGGHAAYDLAFLDPPYALPQEAVEAALSALVRGGWLTDGATVVLERSTRSSDPTWPAGLVATTHKRYGETALWFAERAEDPA